MRRFDLLALLGVITFTSSGFFVNKAAARNLAEVTLGAHPLANSSLLSHHLSASDKDDIHDPIDFGPLVNNTASEEDDAPAEEDEAPAEEEDDEEDNGHGCKKCGHHDDEEEEDEEEEQPAEEDDEDEEGPVGAPNPNVGGEGDENPFEVLEEMFANMTSAISDLEERVQELSDLKEQLEALQETHESLSADVEEQIERIDALETRIQELENEHVQNCLDAIKEDGVYVSDRWRIFEASNNDLLVRDTQSSGQPAYRFTAGGRDTFGDQ